MVDWITITNHQIGRCGELLVQYRLLMQGINSANLAIDHGIDLVAFRHKSAVSIQVKTNLEPKPAGGKGKLSLDWWLRDDSPAEVIAFVDLSTERVWLFLREEVAALAQQHSPKGNYHLYMYTEPDVAHRQKGPVLDSEFDEYLLENKVRRIF